MTSSTTAIGALGLLLVTRSSEVLHFAQGAIFLAAAYTAVICKDFLGMSLWIALPVALVAATTLGCAIEQGVYRPLRSRHASQLVRFLASLGVYIVVEESIALIFGAGIHSFRTWNIREGWSVGLGIIAPVNLLALFLACFLGIALSILTKSKGTAVRLRAVWCNPSLATTVGLRHEQTRMVGVALGSLLAGAAGLLMAADIDAFPQMGMQPLMLALAAMVLGRNRIPGTMAASVIVGTAYHLGVIWMPIRWQATVVYAILLCVLLLRHAGLKPTRSPRKPS